MSKVICLWESLKIQNMSWYWCFHFTEIGPFWDLVLKKFHNHSVIIHLWRLRRCIIAKISKIHWKSMIKKHQYCFANISATEARIFMKFYMVVNYYLVILCIKFHSDWCINARARVVNARNRDKMYGNAAKRAHARLQIVCARVCMDLYEKSFDDSLLSYEYKSQII